MVNDADVLTIGTNHFHVIDDLGRETADQAGPRANLAAILDVDLGAADSVGDNLRTVRHVLANADLLDDPGCLGHHGFLVDLLHLDGTILEGVDTEVGNADSTVDRTAVDADGFVTQADALADRRLDNVAVDADLTPVHGALADVQGFLDDLQNVVGPGTCRRAGSRG